MSERPVTQPPVLEGSTEQAADLLRRYAFFEVVTDGDRRVYLIAAGPFALRVRLGGGWPPTLELGVGTTDPAGLMAVEFHPWRVPLPPEPVAVATEAAWFLATVAGLTPPVVGGKLITDSER